MNPAQGRGYGMAMSPTLPALDPRFVDLRRALESHAQTSPYLSDLGTPHPHLADEARMRAAVALVLRGGAELDLLLIKRAASERDPWSGHMALPGGRLSPTDPTLLDTAVRETHEETGIRLDPRSRFLGALDPVSPATSRLPPLVIAPFVFGAEAGVEVVPDVREVERAVWVPLSRFRDPAIRRVVPIALPEGEIPFPAFVVDEDVVWGLTFRILDRFLRVAPR